jgi:putative PIN family toxin of toxin-antitoxin system
MIFLQAAARPGGPAGACLQAVRDGRVQLFVSPEILAEVLARPRTLRKFPALTVEAVDLFVRDVEGLSVSMPDVPLAFTLDRDPKDEPYINLALAAGARYLASRDKDLLDLMGDEDFRRRFPDLTILDPVSLLEEMAKATRGNEEDSSETTEQQRR